MKITEKVIDNYQNVDYCNTIVTAQGNKKRGVKRVNIIEAIRAAASDERMTMHIRRASWRGLTRTFPNDKLFSPPTPSSVLVSDTPDACIFCSFMTGSYTARWAPTKSDLLADDWEVIDFAGRTLSE